MRVASHKQAAAEAARAAAERRGAEAAQRQAHRLELRKQEEAQALTNLRAFKDSIKAAVSKVSLPQQCDSVNLATHVIDDGHPLTGTHLIMLVYCVMQTSVMLLQTSPIWSFWQLKWRCD